MRLSRPRVALEDNRSTRKLPCITALLNLVVIATAAQLVMSEANSFGGGVTSGTAGPVYGNNNATYGPVPRSEQIFEIESLEIAPSPIIPYVALPKNVVQQAYSQPSPIATNSSSSSSAANWLPPIDRNQTKSLTKTWRMQLSLQPCQ